MNSKVAKFYSFTGISEDKDMLNILQIVRPALRQRGYIVLEIPFADEEIGALCYHGDALGYILINTSLSRVNANFAICHEVYHAFYPQNEFKAKAEFADDYFEHEEEYEANIFAGMLLMPESSFRQMYRVFRAQSDNNEMDTLIRLMNYYQVPYMAALVRCYELGLTESGMLTQQLMELEHKADMAVAECGKFLLPHTVDLCTVNNHRTAIRHIQRTHDLQQGSFTRSTGAYNADILPFLYLQVNTPQHLQVTETLRYIL